MAETQAADPSKGNQGTADETGKAGSLLTGGTQAAQGAASSTEGAASESPKWMDQLAADQKADENVTKVLGKFKTIPDLGKSYVELEGKIGRSVIVPDAKASEEDRTKYRKALGVPEKPEDYKLDKIELPAGMTADEQRTKEFLAIAHANNVSQPATQAFYKWYMTMFPKDIVDNQKIVKTTREEAIAQLRNELKGDFELAMSQKDRAYGWIASKKDGEALTKLLDDTGLGNHPLVVRMFAEYGKAMGEHVFAEGAASGAGPEGKSAAEVLYPDQQVAK